MWKTLDGLISTFSVSGGVEIVYVQTGLSFQDIGEVSLVNEIPESSKWPIRDLFQREIDHRRVDEEILPWLNDPLSIKFFSPLVFTLMAKNKNSEKKLFAKMRKLLKDANGKTRKNLFDLDDFFRLELTDPDRSIGTLHWNTSKTRLIAIDGQHRAAALKKFTKNHDDSLNQSRLGLAQKIPAVIALVIPNDESIPNNRMTTDAARQMFVYINTKSNRPSYARQILLSDDDICSIVVQEILQISHDNDLTSQESRDDDIVPLMFFDWRGSTDAGVSVKSPTAVKSIYEIRELISYFFMDGGDDIEKLKLVCPDSFTILDGRSSVLELSDEEKEGFRRSIRAELGEPMSYFLASFTPFQKYKNSLLKLERTLSKYEKYDDALNLLKFGDSYEASRGDRATGELYLLWIDHIMDVKHEVIPAMLQMDIGFRGCIYSFYATYVERAKLTTTKTTLSVHSRWFVRVMNGIFKDGWLYRHSDKSKFLDYIAFKTTGEVINYRVKDIGQGIGALLTLVCMGREKYKDDNNWEQIWQKYGEDTLGKVIEKGYKAELRARLRQDGTSVEEVKELVKAKSPTFVRKQLKVLREAIESKS